MSRAVMDTMLPRETMVGSMNGGLPQTFVGVVPSGSRTDANSVPSSAGQPSPHTFMFMSTTSG